MDNEWPALDEAIGTIVHAGPDIQVLIEPAQPMPYNAQQWGDRQVFAERSPAHVVIRSFEDHFTLEGWPFTFVISDEIDIEGNTVERWHQALIRIELQGVVVTARSRNLAAIDAFDLLPRVVQSNADFFDVVTSLAQIWDGLLVVDTTGTTDTSDTSGTTDKPVTPTEESGQSDQ